MSEITIANKTEVFSVLQRAAFVSPAFPQKIVAFTNGNAWYIDSLIQNLQLSAARFEPALPLVVFCSDQAGLERCRDFGWAHFAPVEIPALNVSSLTTDTDSTTAGYTCLSFVKVVLCKFILEADMIPLYLDPDMAFKQSGTIEDLLNYLRHSDFVCAGEPKYINSNILIARPTPDMRDMFTLTEEDVRDVLEDPHKYGDEDFFRPQLKERWFSCVRRDLYPPGCDARYLADKARMIHANCVSGLANKIQLLRDCDAWFITPPSMTAPALVRYPEFLEGELLEEYFGNYMRAHKPALRYQYIDVAWTNLYCNQQFRGVPYEAQRLQRALDALPRACAYFTLVQFDEGVKYQRLPPQTLVFGCCTGDIPIPLVYESAQLAAIPHRTWEQKSIFCSFIGSLTHAVRRRLVAHLDTLDRNEYVYHISANQYELFLEQTAAAKFVLAPRGFGRSSFRFFEVLKLGSIPVYIWDDIPWLPFADVIDYDKLCVVLQDTELDQLDRRLHAITQQDYEEKRRYYETVKHLFHYEGICEEIVRRLK